MYEYRRATIDLIKDWAIPKSMIASACGVAAPKISNYIRFRQVPTIAETHIQQAVRDIVSIWTAFHPFKVTLDSPELLAHGLRIAEEIEINREMRAAQTAVEKMLAAM